MQGKLNYSAIDQTNIVIMRILQMLKDVRSCVLRTFLDRSFISKILHYISFPLVNLGFIMPIKLYSIF